MTSESMNGLKEIGKYKWLITQRDGMRVKGIIYADKKLLKSICQDKAPQQVINVAALPGIVKYSLAMPDIHWGYGFCIGGVAAMDYETGVISPGGIGYDINCGVRLIRTNLEQKDIQNKVSDLIFALFNNIPSGVGFTGRIKLNKQEVSKVLEKGAKWAVDRGMGEQTDIEHTENKGCMQEADAGKVSQRALERGREQLGTLGAGNHFLEIQVVDQVYEPDIARNFGLEEGQIVVMIHTGSRGLGYQVCDDYLRVMNDAVRKYAIQLPDRQLACAPLKSPEGINYFQAMSAAANYAWANRQCITHWTRETFQHVLGLSMRDLGMELVYDVAHNIGKIEEHLVDGRKKKLCVHRKGATRALPAEHHDLPDVYKKVGQPVLIPGTMGTHSFVLVGTPGAMEQTWGSTCHGSGRVMSRTQALKQVSGHKLQQQLAKEGIVVRARKIKTLAEEAPLAYKDVDAVVNVCHQAGISKKVARLKPLGVIKG